VVLNFKFKEVPKTTLKLEQFVSDPLHHLMRRIKRIRSTEPGGEKMRVERRKYARYCVRNAAFAVFKAEPVQLLPIVDIGFGGLGISGNEISGSEHWSNSCAFLDIMEGDGSFYLDNLPYELLPGARSLSLHAAASVKNQFYGVKFLNLMPSQKTHLKHFIHKYTVGGKTPQFIQKFNQFLHQVWGKKQFSDSCQNIWLHRPTL
jgi:hypothetical protein